jgi:hypothetical protein
MGADVTGHCQLVALKETQSAASARLGSRYARTTPLLLSFHCRSVKRSESTDAGFRFAPSVIKSRSAASGRPRARSSSEAGTSDLTGGVQRLL